MRLRSPRALCVALLALLSTFAVVVATSTTTARARAPRSGPAGQPRERVQGAAPLPSGADVGATVSSSKPVSVTVALQPRDSTALADYAAAVSDPSSPSYRQYLTVAQFAERFGATSADTTAVSDALTASGLTVSAPSANGLSVTASGTAAQVSSAFDTSLHHVSLADGQTAYADTAAPTLPQSAADAVQAVVGLDSVPVAAPAGIIHRRVVPKAGRAAPRRVVAGRVRRSVVLSPGSGANSVSAIAPSASGCAGANALSADGAYNARQIAGAYGLSSLWNDGDDGSGATIALYELEPYSVFDIEAFHNCYYAAGTGPVVKNTYVDGGAGTGYGSGEAALDIEDVAGLVPGANIDVYEGPNSGSGPYDTYKQMITDDTSQVISTSWATCEANETTKELQAEEALFQEAAAQGQTVLAAAGDHGAAGDSGGGVCSTSKPYVDDPASQPDVTAVGGTSLPSDSTGDPDPTDESVWNDTWQTGNTSASGAGGGGVSREWSQPSWQTDAVAQNAIKCGADVTACREVPDVSADADPNTGYEVYWDGQWAPFGGTSAAAPTWAALIALADESSDCTAAPTQIGFANPLLYSLGETGFYDVTPPSDGSTPDSNSFGKVTGYPVGIGYDMATGLGAPNGSALAAALCAAATTRTTTTTTPSPPPPTTSTTTQTSPPPRTTTTVTTSTITRTSTIPVPPTPTTTTTTTTPKRHPTAAAIAYTVRKRRSTRVGKRVHLKQRARSRLGLKLHYAAHHLPPGLRIERKTGIIVGRPRRTGKFRSSITATDTKHDSETVVVRWTVRRRIVKHRGKAAAHKGKGSTHKGTGAPKKG